MKSFILRLAAALLSRRTFGFFLLAILIVVRIWDPAPLEELRLRSFDLYQRFHPRVVTDRPVVIVDIDEASLSKYG
jgi:adenylate cyclase